MPEEPTLERYLRSWSNAFALARYPGLYWPFLLLAAVKITLLVLAGLFWLPGLSSVVAPILGSLAGEEALHFPNHIKMLPDIYHAIDIFVMITIGFVICGWAVFMMVDALEERFFRPLKYLGDVAVFIPSILIIGFVFAAGSLVAPYLIEQLAALFFRRPKIQFLILMSAIFVNFGFHVLFVYALIFLKAYGGTAFGAMGRSIAFARDHLSLTATIVITVLVIRWPFAHLAEDTGTLLVTGRAEWVVIYLVLAILIDVIATFYLFASTTVIVVDDHRKKAKRDS